jgi:hypothetical protein
MSDDNLMHTMKRRKFFVSLGTGFAGVFAGLPILRSLVHYRRSVRDSQRKVTVTVNPYAVPRTQKGKASHG